MLWLASLHYLSRVSYGPYWPYTEGLFKIFDMNFLTRPHSCGRNQTTTDDIKGQDPKWA